MATTRLPTALSRAAPFALLAAALLVPCPVWAQAAAAAKAAPLPATSAADQAHVRQVLAQPYGTREYLGGIQTLRLELGTLLYDYLALDAVDPDLPAMQRANALLALRDLGVVRLGTFRAGYDAADPTLRAAAVAALRIALDDPETYGGAVDVLKRALKDPDERVQAKALESLGDREAPVLRAFLAGSPPAELRTLAEQLLRAAEERGAPLAPVDSSGALAHTSLSGVRLAFKPARRWPHWNSAAGELTITPVKGKPVVASGVEVVANVLPVAVSPDGEYVAYEAGRKIHVRDLRKGTDAVLGPGIAPRAAPLAHGFIYLVQRPQQHREVGGDPLEYDVRFAGYADRDGARTLGVLKATARPALNGNASPARWMRIVEESGAFKIVGEGIVTFALPDLAPSGRPAS
ncbi:MAG TPA: HEAT repeat domain-containing protein [Longimicrobiales bacterium]|nr:HEAT repeat domain-containing protein [Longimicrobiales bacterium]